MRPTRRNRGQVLIITAFAMVVLIAIAAIVVDLGMSWMLHRKEQNAADPGSLAAAKWIRDVPATGTQQQAREAEACFYARENGFFLGATQYDLGANGCVPANDPNGSALTVNYPPATSLAGQFQGHLGYVEVIIYSTHPSFFGQFFGDPLADVTTAAVAALTDGQATTSSLVALGLDCNAGGDDAGDSSITGGGTVRIFPADGVVEPGGYINVNADCGNSDDLCTSGSGQNALSISGVLQAPFVKTVGGCAYNGSMSGGIPQPECTPGPGPCLDEGVSPLGDPLQSLPEPWPLLNLPAPACPDPADVNSPSDGDPCELSQNACPNVGGVSICTMEPGVYYAGWDIKNKVRVVFNPGMYVFAGGGITPGPSTTLEAVTGVDGSGNPIDARITIFSTDGPNCPAMPKQCQGNIKMTSDGALRLTATDATSCQQVVPQICAWKGILIWMDGSVIGTPQDIEIVGQADVILSGTIYAPESNVKISGGSGSTGCTEVTGEDQVCLAIQIISESWDISGGGIVDMPYDPSELYQLEQQGLVH
jgi:hypothetical protein